MNFSWPSMFSSTSVLNHFSVGYKEVVLKLVIPQISHNLVLMIAINNDNMIADNVYYLFMLWALPAVKYLPFYLTLINFPSITSFGTRRMGTLNYSRFTDQMPEAQWGYSHTHGHPLVVSPLEIWTPPCEKQESQVLYPLKPTCLVCPDWRAWSEEMGFVESRLHARFSSCPRKVVKMVGSAEKALDW